MEDEVQGVVFQRENEFLQAYDKTIKSFCPNVLLNQINDISSVTTLSERFTGATLLADISGFTKLSGELGKEGVLGIDSLRHTVSTYLSNFINIIYSFHGDVYAFAGDALVCLFQPNHSDTNPYECCWRAVQCGIILKEQQMSHLTAHIGVSYGNMSFAVLGGYHDNWAYLISGRCLEELSLCLDNASARELVITGRCMEIISDREVEAVPLGSGNYVINKIAPLPQPSTDPYSRFAHYNDAPEVENVDISPTDSSISGSSTMRILKFIPDPVVSSMYAASFSSLAELREVTTMFLKIDTYSHDCAAMDLQPFFYMAQRCIAKCGGFMRQFLVDDKGCVLIALWGVPSASYSNNGYRAVHCGKEVLIEAKSMGHVCSIGVTTGTAFCGTIGSPLRRDYVAMGDCVNTAARLMGKARGRLLVDEWTYSSLSKSVRANMKMAESLKLKGISEPVVPYMLSDPSRSITHTFSDDTFCDSMSMTDSIENSSRSNKGDVNGYCSLGANLSRSIEAMLRNEVKSLTKSRRGSPAKTILVEGFHRMGKTRVAEHFTQLCYRHKVRCSMVTAKPSDKELEYGVFRRLFTSLVGADNFNTYEKQHNVISMLLKATYPSLNDECLIHQKFPMIKAALGLQWNLELEAPREFSLAPNSHNMLYYLRGGKECMFLRKRNADTVSEILVSVLINIPTAIIVDNSHNCDDATWRELQRISSLKAPLVFMLTSNKLPLRQEDLLKEWKQRVIPVSNMVTMSPKSRSDSPWNASLGFIMRAVRFRKPKVSPYSVPLDADENSPETVSTGDVGKSLSQVSAIGIDVNLSTTKFVLKPLTSAQIRNILCEKLDVPSAAIAPSLTELVRKLTCGNPDWVIMMASCINDYGLDEIMKSCGSPRSACATENSSSSSTDGRYSVSPVSTPLHSCKHPWEDSNLLTECMVGQQLQLFSDIPYAITSSSRITGALDFVLNDPEMHTIKTKSYPLKKYIISHIDALPMLEKTVLKLASIVGVVFCRQILYHISSSELKKGKILSSSLRSLELSGFIRRISGTGDDGEMFAFSSHYLREILYDFNLPSDAYMTHLKVARGLEHIYSKSVHMIYQGLTYHYYMASLMSPAQYRKYVFKFALLSGWQALLAKNVVDFLEFSSIAENASDSQYERRSVAYMLKTAIGSYNVDAISNFDGMEFDSSHSEYIQRLFNACRV